MRFSLQKTDSNKECPIAVETPVTDEIRSFLDGRYICPHEAAWRILDFPIHEHDPPVMILPVHLENRQTAYFKEDIPLKDVVRNPGFAISPLLGWFNHNKDTVVRDNENQSNSENET